MLFISGGENQWNEDALKFRKAAKRPVVTINKLSPFVNVVVNKNTQERTRVKAIPFEDSDNDKANVINGLMRHIQYSDKSNSGDAYSHGFFCLVTCGFGFWRVDAEYGDEMSFDQELVIRSIIDPFSVYLSESENIAIVVNVMTKTEYAEKYGEEPEGDQWDIKEIECGENEVMVVEYWEKTEKETEIFRIEIPETITVEQTSVIDIDAAIEAQTSPQTSVTPPREVVVTKDELPDYPESVIIEQRKTKVSEIRQYIFCGDKIIEEVDWPGKYIPIVGCFSRKYKTKDNYFFFKPLIYDAIDPQRIHNYDWSQIAEYMNLAPKAQWLGAEGQFNGHEDEFSESNTSHVPYLEYSPVTVNGAIAPPPQKLYAPPVPAGFAQEIVQSSDAIKATIGMFDPSLGAQGNEQSGRAIIARRQQGDLATYHFTSAHNEALRKTGLILVDQIKYRYNTTRAIRILGEDMTDEVVRINQRYVDEKTGKEVMYDLSVGKYDIKIEIGSNSITRRIEAADSMLELSRVVPQAGQVGADLMISSFDFEKADEFALRYKASLPPQLLERVEQLKEGNDKGPTQEQLKVMSMQQQMSKMMQAIQGLKKENSQLKGKITNDKIMVEKIRAMAGITEEKIRAGADIEQERIKAGAGNIKSTSGFVSPGGFENNNLMR
jgi:hypothetical protein